MWYNTVIGILWKTLRTVWDLLMIFVPYMFFILHFGYGMLAAFLATLVFNVIVTVILTTTAHFIKINWYRRRHEQKDSKVY